MSWAHEGAVYLWTCNSPIEKLVLLKCVHHAQDDGSRIFPGVGAMRMVAQCSERQVHRILNSFVKVGLLRLVASGRGRGNASEYELNTDMFWWIHNHQGQLVRVLADGTPWPDCREAAVFEGIEPGPPRAPKTPNRPGKKSDRESHFGTKKYDTGDTKNMTPGAQKSDSRSQTNHKESTKGNLSPPQSPPVPGEQDGGDRDDFQKELEDSFEAFKAGYPGGPWDQWTGIRFDVWPLLPPEERALAVKGVKGYVAHLAQTGRKACSPVTFLREKRHIDYGEKQAGQEADRKDLNLCPVKADEPIRPILEGYRLGLKDVGELLDARKLPAANGGGTTVPAGQIMRAKKDLAQMRERGRFVQAHAPVWYVLQDWQRAARGLAKAQLPAVALEGLGKGWLFDPAQVAEGEDELARWRDGTSAPQTLAAWERGLWEGEAASGTGASDIDAAAELEGVGRSSDAVSGRAQPAPSTGSETGDRAPAGSGSARPAGHDHQGG